MISTIKKHLKAKELAELGDGDTYPCLIPDSTRAKGNKGNRCWECTPCSYWNLISHFNQRTIDALVKLTRKSFDHLRRRMQLTSRYTSSTTSTGAASASTGGKDAASSGAIGGDSGNTRSGPFFSASIVLEIPNITMRPSTDEIQQVLNKSASVILRLSQSVYEWKNHTLLHQIQSPVSDDNSKGNFLSVCIIIIS